MQMSDLVLEMQTKPIFWDLNVIKLKSKYMNLIIINKQINYEADWINIL